MKKINTAVMGTGFMGRVHVEQLRRLPNVNVMTIVASDQAKADRFAGLHGIPNASADWQAVVTNPEIDAVHICTPNALHYPTAKAAIQAGKHVLCEKPLSMTATEGRDLLALAEARGIAHCVNHNLRFYPVVQHVRSMIANGEFGEILIVNGTYFQDWLMYETDFNWRIMAAENGALRAMGDIGSHWMDMIQHLTGLPITSVLGDLQTFHTTRKRPRHSVEAFGNKMRQESDYDDVPVETDDFGAVLVRLGARTRGSFAVSQVSAGCKNRFQFEIYGTKCGASWNQERPDELWIGRRDGPNQLIIKDPSLLHPRAATFADLPGGHSEGYDDTHKQMFRRFYARVADPAAPVDFPTFADGARGMMLLEKVLESSKKQAWVSCAVTV